MLVVGLTGSIGMGKSTVAARIRQRGIPVFDADAAVHALYAGKAVPLIADAFPGAVVDGKVDRGRLSALLAADPSGFARLEAIVHPLVRAEQKAFLENAKRDGATMAVLEIPLLFESGGDQRVDATIVVSAPADVQRARVLARPGMTAAKLEGLLARQTPDAEKRRRATHVVDTGVTLAETLAGLDRVLDELARTAGTAHERHWR